jgi:hypothetical protein
MSFRADNFSVTVLLLLAFTVFTMVFRQKRPLESNVPLLYWLLVLFFTFVRPEETFDLRFIILGVIAGFMLRFEFMNRFFVRMFGWAEMAVFAYILYRGVLLIFT